MYTELLSIACEKMNAKVSADSQMYSYTTTLPPLNMDCVFPGVGFMYILGLVMSLTLEEYSVVPTSRLL